MMASHAKACNLFETVRHSTIEVETAVTLHDQFKVEMMLYNADMTVDYPSFTPGAEL